MDVNSCCSSAFQGVILELICSKLNMMLTETFQLKQAVNFNDYEKLTKIILKEISDGNVFSVHMTPIEAAKAIKLLDTLECSDDFGGNFEPKEQSLYHEGNNPFVNAPF